MDGLLNGALSNGGLTRRSFDRRGLTVGYFVQLAFPKTDELLVISSRVPFVLDHPLFERGKREALSDTLGGQTHHLLVGRLALPPTHSMRFLSKDVNFVRREQN